MPRPATLPSLHSRSTHYASPSIGISRRLLQISRFCRHSVGILRDFPFTGRSKFSDNVAFWCMARHVVRTSGPGALAPSRSRRTGSPPVNPDPIREAVLEHHLQLVFVEPFGRNGVNCNVPLPARSARFAIAFKAEPACCSHFEMWHDFPGGKFVNERLGFAFAALMAVPRLCY